VKNSDVRKTAPADGAPATKRVNPLLPFVLCATSVFVEDVEVAMQDEEFRGAMKLMARVEQHIGRAAFERLMASVAQSVSKKAWSDLLEAARLPPDEGPSPALH
jgi:hypothetical protein